MNPNELNRTTSVYDFETHTPYPTIDFVLGETGENLTTNNGSDELRARAEIRQTTDLFKRVLKRENITDTFNYFEYLIAFKPEWRHEFIKSVAALIGLEYQRGFENNEAREQAIVEIIEGCSLLAIKRFIQIPEYDFRSGY